MGFSYFKIAQTKNHRVLHIGGSQLYRKVCNLPYAEEAATAGTVINNVVFSIQYLGDRCCHWDYGYRLYGIRCRIGGRDTARLGK